MTNANDSSSQNSPDFDDEMPSEYNFSGGGIRGKYAKTLSENGYSVTVHHNDGTSTTRYVSPSEVIAQNRQREYLQHQASTYTVSESQSTWNGDRVAGDKFTGDKVMGNKVQIGTVQGDVVAGDQINNANTAELLQLIAAMRQTVTQFPQEIQDDIIIDIEDVEAEIRKPERDRNLPKLRKRLIALAAAASVGATAIAGMTDFANNVTDLATKIGIELPSR
jgi:hypothetical protein